MQTITFDPATHVLVPRDPIAWMHVMNMEGDQTTVQFSEDPDSLPFGRPGQDHDEEYRVDVVPLAAIALPQSSCQGNLDNCRESLKWTAAILMLLIRNRTVLEHQMINIGGETKTIGEILDMANAALDVK